MSNSDWFEYHQCLRFNFDWIMYCIDADGDANWANNLEEIVERPSFVETKIETLSLNRCWHGMRETRISFSHVRQRTKSIWKWTGVCNLLMLWHLVIARITNERRIGMKMQRATFCAFRMVQTNGTRPKPMDWMPDFATYGTVRLPMAQAVATKKINRITIMSDNWIIAFVCVAYHRRLSANFTSKQLRRCGVANFSFSNCDFRLMETLLENWRTNYVHKLISFLSLIRWAWTWLHK